jgi:Ca2+-binding RTX toxin-like protein
MGHDHTNIQGNEETPSERETRAAVVSGTGGNDTLIGTAGDDTLNGLGGDDTLRGEAGNDTLDGGTQVDFDLADYTTAPGPVTVNLSTGTATGHGTDTLIDIEGALGSDFDDTLIGGNAAQEYFRAGQGNDTIQGGESFDIIDHVDATSAVTVVFTAPGAGTVTGGAGNDSFTGVEMVLGSQFNDTMTGSSADETLRGRGGDDTLDGGGGIDRADYRTAASGVTVNLTTGTATGGDGNDTLLNFEHVRGSLNFADTLIGDAGNNLLQGMGGDDRLEGRGGNDTLDGGTGFDFADYTNAPGAMSVDLAAGTSAGPDGNDTFISIEGVFGSAFDDQITGDITDNFLRGNGGNDVIDGGAGFDRADYTHAPGPVNVNLATGTATGADGNDTLISIENLRGSAHGDTLTGNALSNNIQAGLGDDIIDGGDQPEGDFDYVDYSRASGAVTVNLATGQASGADGNDTLINIEAVIGSSANDLLIGSAATLEHFRGGRGDDTIHGGDGTDVIDHFDAISAITITLTAPGTGTVTGGAGNDTFTGIEFLFGSGFNDTITGSEGDETIRGRGGDDLLDGRGGIDRADYRLATGSVTVDLAAGVSTGADGNDTLLNFENARGSLNFSDTLIGSAGSNALQGLGGDDLLHGAGGDDTLDGGAGTDTARYSGNRANFTVSKEGTTWRVTDTTGAEGSDELVSIEKLIFADQQVDLTAPVSSEPPAYNTNDGFLFDPVHYLLDNPDLVGTVSLQDAFDHYLGTGAAAGLVPNSWFDAGYYETRWPDLADTGFDNATLFRHYNLYGVWEGRSAGPAFDQFDGNRYLTDNPDVAAYVDAYIADFLGSRTNGAIAHFVIYGIGEQRTAFDLVGQPIEIDYVV